MGIHPIAGPATLVAGLVMTLLLAGCSSDDARPREVTLAVLVTNGDAHDGNRVVTRGHVRSFEDPLHYWVEDDALNRVEITPHELIAPHLGTEVEVEGRFSFSRETGRLLEADDVSPVD